MLPQFKIVIFLFAAMFSALAHAEIYPLQMTPDIERVRLILPKTPAAEEFKRCFYQNIMSSIDAGRFDGEADSGNWFGLAFGRIHNCVVLASGDEELKQLSDNQILKLFYLTYALAKEDFAKCKSPPISFYSRAVVARQCGDLGPMPPIGEDPPAVSEAPASSSYQQTADADSVAQ